MLENTALVDTEVSDLSAAMTPALCKECGCRCDSCGNGANVYLDLHQRIAELQSQVQRSSAHIENMEHQLMDNKISTDLDLNKTREELVRLRDRYDRLLESHKRMQKINHDLEDKLLRTVGQFESEKVSLQHELSTMMNRLVDARALINQLDEENERIRQDCNVAVHLLQCRPSTFVAHKLNTLPLDLQERVKQHMPREQIIAAETSANSQPEEHRTLRIPIATFPPTAMVYSLQRNVTNKQQENQQPNNVTGMAGSIPTTLIARVLSQPDTRRSFPRMYLCMSCKRDVAQTDVGCQVDLLTCGSRTVEITPLSGMDRCHSLIHSPRGNPNHAQPLNSGSFSQGKIQSPDSFSSFSNGHKTGWNSGRKHCLSSSSTETEM